MFLVFGFDHYYPSGGANDCLRVFSEKQAALDFVQEIKLGTARSEYGYRFCFDYLDVAEVTGDELTTIFQTSYQQMRVLAMGGKAYAKLWVEGKMTDSNEECCTAYGTRYCNCALMRRTD